MLHPLTKLIVEGHNYGTKDMDRVITTYLRDRADWLKKDLPPSPFNLLVDQAFELSPETKCEHKNSSMISSCGGIGGVYASYTCQDCGYAWKEEVKQPILPEKFGEINQHYEFMDLVTKIDQILDYLKMKEGM